MPVCASCGKETPEGFPRCANCGAALAADASREQRKTVTVVFCDVTGSTELGESTDPEALRAILARYFERMKGIVESHGGSVEKFIGDAVMTVFGVPVAHEDDALRACRAAVEMRDALPELGVEGRIGVNTGEVVTGTEERLATGDAVNVAARLEQAAAPGEVLLGAETLWLVRSAVEVGEERLLKVKGKAAPVPTYPLLAVSGELERRFASAMVGRETELRRLADAFAQALRDRSCQLFTVLGSAGVGKSRLAAEFLAGVEARLVRGRCLSYGEGITYWPVVEILKQLGKLPDGDAAGPLRSLLGEIEAPADAGEIAWGFRKLLEQEAQAQPLVCVLDDIHWAGETLLDLVEHVADLSRDAPILLLCMARPELLERRPSWGGGKWNATTVLLEPLDASETQELVSELGGVSKELADRIVQVAEGNPLFVEEMLALVRDSGGGEVEVPPSIQALLAARLDQLDPAERSVLERGSVEGRTFHRGAVAALDDGDGAVDQRLVTLVRKELVRPDRAQLAGDDAYRFRHLLIRDAAYEALPKAMRADLHRRFAGWLEEHGTELVELEEILGYHLEQAARYLAELGQPNSELAEAAAAKLAAAGRRAFWRGHDPGGAGLMERALELTRPSRLDIHLEVDLAMALVDIDMARSAVIAEDAATRAAAAGDEASALLGRTFAATCRFGTGAGSPDDVERLALEARPPLEAADDHVGLYYLEIAYSYAVPNVRGRFGDLARSGEEAIRQAQLAGRPYQRDNFLGSALVLGPDPASEALETLDRLLPPSDATLLKRATLLAMLDRLEEAETLAVEVDARFREIRGWGADTALTDIALFAGDQKAAALHLQAFNTYTEEAGKTAELSTYAPKLGHVLCALGRHDEAEPLARRGRELGDPQDAMTQRLWRSVLALVLARRGEHAEAEQLAREAAAIAAETDSPWWQGDALFDLGEVLEAAGRRDAAAAAFLEALDSYERKEIIPLARRTRERLAALEVTTS